MRHLDGPALRRYFLSFVRHGGKPADAGDARDYDAVLDLDRCPVRVAVFRFVDGDIRGSGLIVVELLIPAADPGLPFDIIP